MTASTSSSSIIIGSLVLWGQYYGGRVHSLCTHTCLDWPSCRCNKVGCPYIAASIAHTRWPCWGTFLSTHFVVSSVSRLDGVINSTKGICTCARARQASRPEYAVNDRICSTKQVWVACSTSEQLAPGIHFAFVAGDIFRCSLSSLALVDIRDSERRTRLILRWSAT